MNLLFGSNAEIFRRAQKHISYLNLLSAVVTETSYGFTTPYTITTQVLSSHHPQKSKLSAVSTATSSNPGDQH